MNARYDYPGNPIDNGLVVIQADCLGRAYDEIDRLRWEANHYRERCAYLGERFDALNAVIPCCPGNFYPGGDRDHASWCHTLKDAE